MTDKMYYTLSYDGDISSEHLIDFYDIAQALHGFNRTLALTAHLVINGEIITQATALNGAAILAIPPEEGSWKFTGVILAGLGTSLYGLGTAEKDTPIGHIMHSAYDYVVATTLGFHVDYEKTLLQSYETQKKKNNEIKILPESKFHSLSEKCANSFKEMHRPIVNSRTAFNANIYTRHQGSTFKIDTELNNKTFDYINYSEESDQVISLSGHISSYNSNTYKGRIFSIEENRPISFSLGKSCRSPKDLEKLAKSLTINIRDSSNSGNLLFFEAYIRKNRAGVVQEYYITRIL